MIHFLVYILIYPFTFLISRLPFKVLYIISDLIFILLYYIIGYRKQVVLNNLQIAFPDKSRIELIRIRKEFYSHFVDIFLEMIKTFGISRSEMSKRFKLTNKEEFKEFMGRHKKVLLMSSHYANFEWLLSLNPIVPHQCYATYKKLKNNYLDAYIVKSRNQFNTNLVPTKELISKIKENHLNTMNDAYGLLSDQSPKLHKARHWMHFLGIKVPVITGTEMLAKKYNYPVLHFQTTKIKRGFYETKMEVLSENPREVPDFGITELFMKKLEAQINKEPAYYFWTHKRFKHMEKATTKTSGLI